MRQAKESAKSFLGRRVPLELLSQIAFELRMRVAVGLDRISQRRRRMTERIHREAGTLKVNLGCGPLPLAGWLNIDGVSPAAEMVEYLGERLALPERCARLVFSEHVLEHLFYPDQVRTFMDEAFRILVPGGRIRLVVPDAGRIIRAYVDGDETTLRELEPGSGGIVAVNKLFREGGFHRFAWDFETLADELRRAGFDGIRRATFRDSDLPELNADHGEAGRIAQSLYVEATRPARLT